MNQHNTPRNLRLLSVVALSGALMVSGCTDSEEANKDDTSTASGATAEDAGVTGACDAYTDITLAMAEAPDGDPTAWFTDTIAPMADDLDAADKPADIEGDLDTMIGTVRQVAQTGDPSAFTISGTAASVAPSTRASGSSRSWRSLPMPSCSTRCPSRSETESAASARPPA